MGTHEDNDLNREKFEAAGLEYSDRRTRGSSVWWFVWIPIIVAVTLWIGGWWFGNYGGPWGSKPQPDHPTISDPAVFIKI